MTPNNGSLSLYDLLSPRGLENPYVLYDRLRAEDPVHWDPVMRSWVLTRYTDVVSALQDARLSEERITPFFDQLPSKRQEGLAPLANVLSRMMLFLDPPDHTRLRGTVMRAFTPSVIRTLHLRIEQMAGELLDAAQPAGQLDVIQDFSLPLSAAVIADLLDVPEPDRGKFKNWTSILKGFFSQSAEEVLRVTDLKACFSKIVAERGPAPKSGILGALLTAYDNGTLDFEELFAIYVLLFDAGQVTTANLIGNGFLALLRQPDQLELLRQTPAFMPTAVSELLRYDGPVQFTSRIAKETFAVGGKTVEKGQGVILMLAAANRDPAQFPNPDRIDVSRKDNKHVSFGYGIHYCLGASLSLLEAQTAISALLGRLKNPRLVGEPQWQTNLNFRFLESFKVAFDQED
jgi:hypothetical protein